ncbi:hypothetical protein BB561_003531 [Smittium simulii]|uniref:HMG box domain-containing protein n=1 Tax=Smittium simulii TaxID=133385 RepID=A0A2T9YKY9_9FUNG|nr:hypothetical protein BB561_003531 [Smittium simulii]
MEAIKNTISKFIQKQKAIEIAKRKTLLDEKKKLILARAATLKLSKAKKLEALKKKKARLAQKKSRELKLKKETIIKLKLEKAKKLELEKAMKRKLIKAKKIELEKAKKLKLKAELHKKLTSTRKIVNPPSLSSRPMTLFLKDSYEKIKNSQQTIDDKSCRKIFIGLALEWKQLPEVEKLEYKKRTDILKEQKIKQVHDWWENTDKKLIALENRRRKYINTIRLKQGKIRLPHLIDPRKPKRPGMYFSIFLKDLANSENVKSSLTNTELMDYASVKWKQLPDDKKAIYIDKYKAQYSLYKEAVKKFKSSCL